MTATRASQSMPYAAVLVGATLIAHWLFWPERVAAILPRVPSANTAAQSAAQAVDLKGFFQPGGGMPGKLQGAWPCFRGGHRDNISAESVPLARQWSAAGPPKLWQIEVGEGYAGAAVADGRVYVLDYDQEGKADVLRCLSADDGKEIWRRGYQIDIGRNHGISRTVCAVADGCVVTIGPKCQVMCADAASGDFRWGIDLPREYHTTIPAWYTGQNPLIDNGHVILAPGGDSILIAADLHTGKLIWKTPNARGWEMTHSSVVPVTFGDRRLYMYCASGGVIGVDAQSGAVLFELPQWKVGMANVPSPLPLPGDRILFTGGYGAGSMMIRLKSGGSGIIPEVLFRKPPEVFGAEQQTPIFYQGYIYGVIPVSAQLVCLNLDGEPVWASGAGYRFGSGPFLVADGKILLLNDTGTLTLVEATPAGFKPITRTSLFSHGHDAWGPMALVGGRLFARDLTRLACFDLREAAHD